MKFSVIIPTYNRADLLEKCLDALTKQTFPDFEVLVCDDGSTDSSKDIAESYSDRLDIHYLWAENWGGPAAPRNRGIAASKGEWVCFLDSDDWWTPTKLEECLPYLDNYDLLYHNLIITSQNSKHNNKLMKGRDLTANHEIQDILLHSNPICNSSVVIRKSKLDQIGGITTERNLIAVEDVDCWIRAIQAGARLKFIDKPLGYYWVGDNISQGLKHIDREMALCKKYKPFFDKKGQLQLEKVLSFKIARLYHLNGEYKSALRFYLDSQTFSLGAKLLIFPIIGFTLALFRIKK